MYSMVIATEVLWWKITSCNVWSHVRRIFFHNTHIIIVRF